LRAAFADQPGGARKSFEGLNFPGLYRTRQAARQAARQAVLEVSAPARQAKNCNFSRSFLVKTAA
jgi:hypothetical protein